MDRSVHLCQAQEFEQFSDGLPMFQTNALELTKAANRMPYQMKLRLRVEYIGWHSQAFYSHLVEIQQKEARKANHEQLQSPDVTLFSDLSTTTLSLGQEHSF